MKKSEIKKYSSAVFLVIFSSCGGGSGGGSAAAPTPAIPTPVPGLKPNLSFSTSLTVNENVIISAVTPSNAGDTISSCIAAPVLPLGFNLAADCTISGTPTSLSVSTLYTITATNSFGSGAATINIGVVLQPILSGVVPTAGANGVAVVISGSNFGAGASVLIGGVPCVGISVTDANHIACTTPRSSLVGDLNIVVTNSNSLSSTQNIVYTLTGVVGDEQISTSSGNSCAVVGGAAKCWGVNTNGTLGDGTAAGTARNAPGTATGMTAGVQAVSVSDRSACAIKNGSAFCWGDNTYGRLGNGTTTASLVPVQVTGLTSGVQAISVGSDTTCAIVNAAVWCWGLGDIFELLGPSYLGTYSKVPVQISGLASGVQAVSVGYNSACAIVNGGAQCWGYNDFGQLGKSSISVSSAATFPPVSVDGLSSGVQSISAGWYSSCAILSGAAKCWGRNDYGQLGNNSTTLASVPVQVSGLTSGVTSLTITNQSYGLPYTSSSACAATSGSMSCWGSNGAGQLGNGTTVASLIPVQVTGLTSGAVETTVGTNGACGIISGAAKCWGFNQHGELGNSSSIGAAPYAASTAVSVTGLTTGLQ